MTQNHPGQIIRISLESFMSYDNFELFPQNNLNLIIGPNGTGKSSIVCAVLLCLNGKLKTLGRADQLSSYIKSGCDQCCIEIELYEPKDKNVIIKRKILSNNHSEFMINGKVSAVSKVIEVKRKYNIQIDNLCTFLPQDKVQDFSKLNPQQLLDQTQKTIGNGNLIELHEELKELQIKTINQEKHCDVLEIDLEKEMQKNERLRDQVKSFKERQLLFNKLTALNQKLAWLNYDHAKENKKEIEKDEKLLEKIFREKKVMVDKCEKDLREFEDKMNCQQEHLAEAKKIETVKKGAIWQQLKKMEQRIDDLEDANNVLKARLEEENEKKNEMLKYKENIEKLTNDLKNLEGTFGSEMTFEGQLNLVDNEFKKLHSEENKLNQVKFNLEQNEEVLKQESRNVAAEYQSLTQNQNFRLEYLKRHEPDTVKSVQWLQHNKHLFQSRIYNPMLLELDVSDSKMAKFMEARIGYKDLISFCCTNPDDLNLLIEKLRGEHKWKVNVICSDECDSTQYVSEIPLNDLRPYGFYAFMKDFITGPEDIIRFLCKTYKIHNIPIGDEKVKANCARIPPSITIFYSDSHVFTIKYSVYSGDKSINVKKLGEAKFFGTPINNERIQSLIKRGKELNAKIENTRSEIGTVDTEIQNIRNQLEDVKKKKKQLATYSQERQLIQMNLNRATSKYRTIQETLRDPELIEKEVKEKQVVLKNEIQKDLTVVTQLSENYEDAVLGRQKCELNYKLCRFEKKQLLENKISCLEEMSSKELLLREIRERLRTAENKCEELKLKAKLLTENTCIEDKKNFRKFQDSFSKLPDTIEELEEEIQIIQTKTEFLQGGNIKVLQEFEEREEKIVQLRANLEKNKISLREKKDNLSLKRDEWLTPVSDLLAKINCNFGKYFEAMGCAGEVSLISGEDKDDFDKYGIKIKVKFRDGIPLEELGRHFQSGGERAVSTAIFMLSLQELTSVPFRFVDEINQGMDPVNERRILQIIIHLTSQNLSSQYFLITPKLLPDVKCSDLMTVHCIYNGPNAIPASEWNIKKFLGGENTNDDNSNFNF